MTLTSKTRRLALAALLAALASLSACGDEPSGGTVSTAPSCESSVDCDGAEETAGQVCVDQACVECFTDSGCEADAYYGVGATCVEGACVPCEAGSEGCACAEGDACDGDAVCEGGTCQPCERGSEGCACMNNGACDAGLRCDDDGESCEACPAGELDCPCDGDACDGDLVCMSEVCAEATCEPGADGCPCDGDACDEGLTCGEDDLCRPCSSDFAGCPCEDDDTCDSDELACDTEEGLCVECSPDFEGCPCEDDCGGDLVCDADEQVCRAAIACDDMPCVTNQLCEDGAAGADASCLAECMPGFDWDDGNMECVTPSTPATCEEGAEDSILQECGDLSRACVEGDDSASCGDCVIGTTDEGGVLNACRPVMTCEDRGCAALMRQCTAEGDNTDAACGDCQPGLMEVDGECVVPPSANCIQGDPDSILTNCMMAGRECVTLSETMAECGDCSTGLIPADPDDDQSMCRAPFTCEDLDCDPNFENCDDSALPLGDARCVPRPGNCPPGEAFDPFGNECVTCANPACGGSNEGETGNYAPVTDADGRCLCETRTGYYFDNSADQRSAAPCDADNDGWVRRSARQWVDSDDDAVAAQARCQVREVDRIVLQNELGQRKEMVYCAGGFLPRFREDGAELGSAEYPCALPLEPLRLFEPPVLDEQADVEDDPDLADYARGGVGRRPRAAELNPLTKACVSAAADFNLNGLADVTEEHQAVEPPAQLDSGLVPLLQFGYFLELHRGFWEPPNTEVCFEDNYCLGSYVIAERRRCDDGLDVPGGPDFPVTYHPDEMSSGPYWRQCTRGRDAAWAAGPEVRPFGMDFAQYSCDPGVDGACPTLPPLVEPVSTEEILPHGVCDAAWPLPTTWDPDDAFPEPWRGMNHHSQFKCVVIDDDANEGYLEQHRITRNRLATAGNEGQIGGEFQYNVCTIGCPEDDPTCASDCPAEACSPLCYNALCANDCPGDDCPDVCLDEGCGDVAACACAASSETLSGINNPRQPVVTCTPTVDPNDWNVGDVGFVAVRYRDPTLQSAIPPEYVRGCYNEWEPTVVHDGAASPSAAWKQLCPGYIENPRGTDGQGHPTNFGKLICGCSENFGGIGCTEWCPSPFRGGPEENNALSETCFDGFCSFAPEGDDGGRRGAWACGDVMATVPGGTDAVAGPKVYAAGSGQRCATDADCGGVAGACQEGTCKGGPSIEGGIFVGKPALGTPLCENPEDCAMGPSVR